MPEAPHTAAKSNSGFLQTQQQFAAHLRDPQANKAPPGIEDRRMKIYRELIYNNIESFISSGFPILRSITPDEKWHAIVRQFVSRHRSHTPYFLEISQEFLQFLQEAYQPFEDDPPFLLELAHYEWVELALDVSAEDIPCKEPLDQERPSEELLDSPLSVSPLAWRLSYQYPVHRIGPEYQPQKVQEQAPEQGTFLVVYRNREHQVKFLEANAVTFRLLQLLEHEQNVEGESKGGSQPITARQALQTIASELNHPQPDVVVQGGADILQQLYRLDIIF